MGVNSKMTVIADKIRSLLGVTGTMGLDAMATNLGTEQTNVSNAFTAIGNKGGTVPSSKVSGNLVSAINSIPTGVTIQRKTGTFTTNSSGTATVTCGFKPDFVAIDGGDIPSGAYAGFSLFNGAAFEAGNKTQCILSAMPTDTSTQMQTNIRIVQSSNGFSIAAKDFVPPSTENNCVNRLFNYVAIKYT